MALPNGMRFRTALAKGLDVRFMASCGCLSDAFSVNKFGENPSITDTQETVWDAGGLYPWPSAAATTTAQSTSINDTAAGTGARTIRVYGLDTNYAMIQEDVTLDGTTAVTLTNDYLRVYRVVVLTAGTSEGAEGTVTIQHGATIIAQVINGNNQTLMSPYTIPAGYTGYMVKGKSSVGEGKSLDGSFVVRPFGGVFNLAHTFRIFQTSYGYEFDPSIAINEKSDIEVRAVSTAAGTAVTAAYSMILVENAL